MSKEGFEDQNFEELSEVQFSRVFAYSKEME